ncbi:MAG TPA: OmpA family protein [Aliidongia sp.]|uniref:OmpA family protein n=1 Tax=Aliidongia sp. TaxID=1914230 RepID=UPI002DDCEC2B|nr:OmpA family protein [Aliidongia sp.]HEV2675038.1 OmpA family protein [Aliidongia sp.]
MAPSFNRLSALAALSVLVAVGYNGAAWAQANTTKCSGSLNATQIVDCLKTSQPVTRGLRVSNAPAAPPEASAGANLKVEFGFNSVSLTPQATAALDNLGHALVDPSLKDASFQIAGHTDAVGSDDANLALSTRRAAAVKNYIVAKYGIDQSRLKTIGYGKTQLLDPANPNSGVNRRVQVTIAAE